MTKRAGLPARDSRAACTRPLLMTMRITYDDGTCKTITYSDDSMKTAETRRMGYRTEWEYDAYGRTSKEKFPDGYEVRHKYDEKHDLVYTLDSDRRETQYIYDNDHNLTLLKEQISGVQWKETIKSYDAKGRCISEKDALSNETVREYDDNRAYPRRVITPKGEDGEGTRYEYDIYGNLKEKRFNGKRLISYTHDAAGQITEIGDPSGNVTKYEYDIMV